MKKVLFLPLGGCNVEPNFKSNFEDRENKIVFLEDILIYMNRRKRSQNIDMQKLFLEL